MASNGKIDLLKGFLKGRIRAFIKFLISNSSLARKIFIDKNYAASRSEYCYDVWMKYFKHWIKLKNNVPDVVVEIGSGNSLGVGLAALLSGSSKFYALEKTQFWNNSTNLRVFDELVELFKQRRVTKDYMEDGGEMNDKSMSFPDHILNKDHLDKCLSENRLIQIREELEHPNNLNNKFIRSIIPWNSADVIEDNTVDFIFSHTVLQHLDDLSDSYNTMSKWLKKGGCLSHTIDLRSLNRTKLWNGHWTLSKLEWKIVTGGVSLINREPLSTHLQLLEANGFEIKYQKSVLSDNTLSVEDLSDDYKHLDQRDLTTSGYYYFAEID
ncbi:MAG: class I SAM-dependent methyltransferase [Psychroserpens sp.]|uniref:class I SAM-dependent methyltransferase n=1 Tax=Psychroserpens sp. TaxID=2020870 RepID=UPI0030037CF4